MAKYECTVCGYIFDEQQAGIKFSKITECPICAESKDVFKLVEEKAEKQEVKEENNKFTIEKRQEFWLEEKDKEVEVDKSNIETYYEGVKPVKSQEELDREAKEKEEAERPRLDPIEGGGAVHKVIDGGDRSSDGSDSEVVVVEDAASDVDAGDDEEFVFEEVQVEASEPLETREVPPAVSAGINEEGDFFTGFDSNPTFGDAVRTEEFMFDDEEPVGEAVELVDAGDDADDGKSLFEEVVLGEEKEEEASEAAEEVVSEEAAEDAVEEDALEDGAEATTEEGASEENASEESAEGVIEEPAEETAEEVVEETAEETAEAVAEEAATETVVETVEAATEETVEEVESEELAEEVVSDIAGAVVVDIAEEPEEEASEEVVEEAGEESVEVVEEEPVEVVSEETVENLAEEPADEIIEETVGEAAEEVVEETAEEAVEEPVEEAVGETAEEVTEETAEEVVEAVAEDITREPEDIVAEAFEETVEETFEETSEETLNEISGEEVEESTEENAGETAEETTEEPVEETAEEAESVIGTAVIEDAKYSLLADDQFKSLFVLDNVGPASNGLEGIILLPAQLNPMPMRREESIITDTVLGKNAEEPAKLHQPFGSSSQFLWGEYVPGEEVDLEDTSLVLVKGKNSHIPPVSGKEELRREVARAKVLAGGTPVGVSLLIGRIEQDLETCAYANVDYVVLGGVSSGMLPYALRRAKNYLSRVNSDIEIIVSIKDVNNAQELAKLIALGADFVLLEREYDEITMERLTTELKEIARNTGHKNVRDMNMYDICTIDSDLAANTDIAHF